MSSENDLQEEESFENMILKKYYEEHYLGSYDSTKHDQKTKIINTIKREIQREKMNRQKLYTLLFMITLTIISVIII
ncbi:MAG: hypothetical protein ACRCVW_04525 [Brevinema sp.]